MRALLFLLLAPIAQAAPTIEEELAELRSNPSAYLEGTPTRVDRSGHDWSPAQTIEPRAKIQARRALNLPKHVAEPQAHDQASRVADRIEHVTLEAMERAGLRKVKLPSQPWSGDYWAVYQGGLAKRYADRAFPAKRDWKKNYDYLQGALGSGGVEELSPAEKYDLLVGDANWSLARAMQNEGWAYYDGGSKSVPTWVGLCHGWAIAAYLSPRPARAIEVLAADGSTRIPFYPHDVKALQTALWGELALSGQIKFVGGRCETDSPARDSDGRIIDGACADTNPATWHLAVVNQIGVAKRSITFDATLDSEVWNQPVLAYDYSYFNPRTLLPSRTLAGATTSLAEFPGDRFSRYRSSRARSVVGIAMNLSYVNETQPKRQERDSPADDDHVTVRYLYDLELDDQARIVGGEWYRNRHPDFLWIPWQGVKPSTQADAWIDYYYPGSRWQGMSSVPLSWRRLILASSQEGVPSARVVDALSALAEGLER